MTPLEMIQAYYKLFYAPRREDLEAIVHSDFQADDDPIGLHVRSREELWSMVHGAAETRGDQPVAVEVTAWFGDEEVGVASWVWTAPGTSAAMFGLPTVEGSFDVHGLGHFTFKEGKLASLVEYWDSAEFLRWLGADVPSVGAVAAG